MAGLGAIVSLGDAIVWGAAGEAATVAVGRALGEGEPGPISKFVRLVDADFPCAPPNIPNV